MPSLGSGQGMLQPLLEALHLAAQQIPEIVEASVRIVEPLVDVQDDQQDDRSQEAGPEQTLGGSVISPLLEP